MISTGITSAEPGSVQGLHLVVTDTEAARAELVDRGVDVGEIFHDAGGIPSPRHQGPGGWLDPRRTDELSGEVCTVGEAAPARFAVRALYSHPQRILRPGWYANSPKISELGRVQCLSR
jgi:hypothetical protein